MKRFVIGCGALLVVGCVVVVAVVLYFYNKDSKRARELYGTEVAEMCDPPAGGTVVETNLPGGPYPLQVAVLRSDSTFLHAWHDDLPSDLRAGNREELRVVICVEEKSQVIETCPYYGEDDSDEEFSIERIRRDVQLILLNAESGQRIAEVPVLGAAPDECPDSTRGRSGSTTEYKGDEPTYNDFRVALEPYIMGPKGGRSGSE